MWWRHDKTDVLSNALDKGYKVILCPRIPLYFDFVQNVKHESGRKWAGKFASLESVYQFPSEEFVAEKLFSNNLVMGIQANVWTETIHTPERLHFMVYPRLSGLAEAAWTNDQNKNLNGFLSRLSKMLLVYGKEGVGYYDFKNSANQEIKYIRKEDHVD
jgi:hexosaminidase